MGSSALGSTSGVCNGIWPAETEVSCSASAWSAAAEESPKNLMSQNYNFDFKTRWYMTVGIGSHYRGKSYPLHRGFPQFTHHSHCWHFIRSILCSFCSSLLYVRENYWSNRWGLMGEEKHCKRMNPHVFMMHRKHICFFGSFLKERLCSLGPGISHQILTLRSRPDTQLWLGWKICTFKHISCFILHLLLHIAAGSDIVSKTGQIFLESFCLFFFP